MHCANLKGGEVLVKLFLQRKGSRGFIVGVDAELSGHATPCQLLLRNLVVTTVGDDVIEHLEQIKMDRADLGFRVERRASLGVIIAKSRHELFIFRSAVNGMRRDIVANGSHLGDRCRRRCAVDRIGIRYLVTYGQAPIRERRSRQSADNE